MNAMVRYVVAEPQSWATMRESNGTDATDLTLDMRAENETPDTWFQLHRILMFFDTSSIPDSHRVISATLSFKAQTKSDNGDQSIIVCPGFAASNTSVAVSDYQLNTGSESYGSVDITDIAVNQYTNILLNSSGVNSINKRGISRFALRFSGDFTGVQPVVADFTTIRVLFFGSGFAGTSDDPKLTVEHVASTDGKSF